MSSAKMTRRASRGERKTDGCSSGPTKLSSALASAASANETTTGRRAKSVAGPDDELHMHSSHGSHSSHSSDSGGGYRSSHYSGTVPAAPLLLPPQPPPPPRPKHQRVRSTRSVGPNHEGARSWPGEWPAERDKDAAGAEVLSTRERTRCDWIPGQPDTSDPWRYTVMGGPRFLDCLTNTPFLAAPSRFRRRR